MILVTHSGIAILSVKIRHTYYLVLPIKARHKNAFWAATEMPSEGFDQIRISYVALQRKMTEQNSKTCTVMLNMPMSIYSALAISGHMPCGQQKLSSVTYIY